MRRLADKHINSEELATLVPWPAEAGLQLHPLSANAIREAERHLEQCEHCGAKLSKYRDLANRLSNAVASEAAPAGTDCPKDEDIDWQEVANGLWPEFKAKQLIMHAALCDHCGPLLRAATSAGDDATPQEEKLLAQLRAPSRPHLTPAPALHSMPRWQFMRWLVPVALAMVIVGIIGIKPPSSQARLSGPQFAEFAVNAHRQHVQGTLALDVRSDSQQALNDWFKTKAPFSLAFPASPAAPGEERPYRLEGARMLRVGGNAGAYIAYQMQTGPASLIVTPDSVAVASGGVQVNSRKLTFHYKMVGSYKVVTWTVHGLTYALVSQEGNSTQQSCMVCHSAMRDRDLSHTPTPLTNQRQAAQPIWQ